MSAEPYKENNEHEYSKVDSSKSGVLSGRSSAQNEYNAIKRDHDDGRDELMKRDDERIGRGEDRKDSGKINGSNGAFRRPSNNSKSKQSSRYAYPSSKRPSSSSLGNNSAHNGGNNRAPFPAPMSRSYSAPPPPSFVYHGGGNPYGPPPPHYPQPQSHHPPPMQPHMQPHMQSHMQPYMAHSYGGPPMNGRPQHSYHPHHPPHSHYPPPPYQSMPHYPTHSSMMPPSYPRMESDNASISSKSSKNSKKKRTIDGVHESGMQPPYTFRRTDSTCSSTSTVTAGNNTSLDTHYTDDSPRRKDRSDELPPLNMDGMGFEDHEKPRIRGRHRLHRRDMSADASTTSSLSVGGFSLSSYEGPRGGAIDDKTHSDSLPLIKSSPKRHKSEPLRIDTIMHTASTDSEAPAQADSLSLGEAPKLPTSTTSTSSGGSRDRNLFLSLSTSPINAQTDVDQTPISKNTKKEQDKKNANISSIFKSKSATKLKLESIKSCDDIRPSETPTPPVHGELSDSGMNTDEQSMLNRHLRGQSFTPLPHLTNSSESTVNSPSQTTVTAALNINHQLSWSIAGDTHSLGDLEEWDEEEKKSAEPKARPESACSAETRNMMISPHDFQLWKDEHEFTEQGISGTTTPLPAFFEQSEGSENHMNYDRSRGKSRDEDHEHYHDSRRHNKYNHQQQQQQQPWAKHGDMPDKMLHMGPPTPMFAGSSDYRDEGFSARSPDIDRRQDMDYYQPYSGMHHGHPSMPNDRIRNLRGRMPPGHHMPPMPLHIHPGMPTHLPMTSPMGLNMGKAGMWSPHHGGMPHMANSHHMASPLGSMSQSKRKCVSLKPPIPSKFQGDIEKVKNAQVPEFTSLVNFPAHISQKQAVNLPEGMRCCVMCGSACPCSIGGKSKKGGKKCDKSDSSLAPRNSNTQDLMGDKSNGFAIIPSQNKGLCTLCDVNVWIVVQSGLEIKWCKGCKNFRPWASFGDKGLATKCLRCRDRQREKYALQKEEKEKSRMCKVVKKEKN